MQKQLKRGGRRMDKRGAVRQTRRWISLRSSTLQTFTLLLNRF